MALHSIAFGDDYPGGIVIEPEMPFDRHRNFDCVCGISRSGVRNRQNGNVLWPGYDLRKLSHSDRYDYGFLPPRFFNQVLRAFAGW